MLAILLLLLTAYVFLKKYKNIFSVVGLVALYVGGLHNLYQRVRYSCVIDDYEFFGLFSFNLSDLLITLGLALLIISVIFYGQENTNSRR